MEQWSSGPGTPRGLQLHGSYVDSGPGTPRGLQLHGSYVDTEWSRDPQRSPVTW